MPKYIYFFNSFARYSFLPEPIDDRHSYVQITTLSNGYACSGYLLYDAAFGIYTFEVVSSRLKPGFAENAIVNGLLDMMYANLQLKP